MYADQQNKQRTGEDKKLFYSFNFYVSFLVLVWINITPHPCLFLLLSFCLFNSVGENLNTQSWTSLKTDGFCLHRIVFPSRKKNRKLDEIVHKKYILMNEMFEFGPLLVGKSRER